MNIFYVNFNVGSGIEYVGDIFKSWLQELDNISLFEYKEQDSQEKIFESLLVNKPDLIILNESFEKSRIPSCKYLKKYPKTKLLYLCHSWNEIVLRKRAAEEFQEFITACNKIISLNVIPPDKRQEISFVDNYTHPIDPKIFNIKTQWKDRPYKFVYLGNILPHKFSEEFIKQISKTDIQIDCYGNRKTQNREELREYDELFDQCKNIHYKGVVRQEDVPLVLNKYKYFVMPHNGNEPFNLVLLQSIFCGTIPLIVNDLNSRTYDPNWINWANGLYYSCNLVSEFITNLIKINNSNLDIESESKQISYVAMSKFDYDKFKKFFQDYIKQCENEIEDLNHIKWSKTTSSTNSENKKEVENIWYGSKCQIHTSMINPPNKKQNNNSELVDIWYENKPKKENKFILFREQFIHSKINLTGEIRNDNILYVENNLDLEDFKIKSKEVIKNFSVDSDIYSIELYESFEKNLKYRGNGKSLFLFTLDKNKWKFYKEGILQFEILNEKDLIEGFNQCKI